MTARNPCATCAQCCTSYIVSVCGYDVWRISTRQRLSPEQFLVAMPQDRRGKDGFLLNADDAGNQNVSASVCLLRVHDGNVGTHRRDRGKTLAGERAFNKADGAIVFGKIRADVPA